MVNRYTCKEEIFNGVTHGVAALLSIAGLVVLVALASIKGDAWRIVSFSIYGSTLFLLFLFSTLYHSIPLEKAKRVLQVLDHISIYLLIAGSYTPVTLIALRGAWGWSLFGVIWSLAVAGIILKVLGKGRKKVFSLGLYILMGWLIVVAFKPMQAALPPGFFPWLLGGGIIYSLGVIFYLWKKLPYNHGIWHLFVFAGSVLHYFGFLFYLV